MTLRVLFVARWYPAHDDPGRGSFVSDLARALVDEGVDVTVASFENVNVHATTRSATAARVAQAAALWAPAMSGPDAVNRPVSWGAGVPVARIPAFHQADETVHERADRHAALLVPFGRALHARRPFDLIHAHTALPDGLAAMRLATELGVPLFVTEHDSSLRWRLPASADERVAYRSALRGARRVFVVSAHFRSQLAGWLQVPEGSFDVIPNPIPPVFFEGSWDQARDPHEVLYVGARRESKGIPLLLEAFAAARAARPVLHLRLVGRSDRPEEEARWQAIARDLGLDGSVLFEPSRARSEVAALMRRAALLVHPSPFETFGVVAAEAMASGLPVATVRSGVEEIVGLDGAFGEVARGADARALATAILTTLDRLTTFDPERLRSHVRQRFGAAAVARGLLARYLESSGGDLTGTEASGPSSEAIARSPAGFDAPLVVSLRRVTAAARLRLLPAGLAETLSVVTNAGDGSADALPQIAHLIQVDLERSWRMRMAAAGDEAGRRWTVRERLWHALRSPRKALLRRRIRRARERIVLESARDVIVEAWRADPGSRGSPRRLLPLEAEDVLAAATAIAAGARLTPGSTRWLADRWDARRASGSRS